MKFIRIRAGLYHSQDNRFAIERQNELAEVYYGDLDYNMWRVTEYSSETNKKIWLSHFYTLDAAKKAINEEMN